MARQDVWGVIDLAGLQMLVLLPFAFVAVVYILRSSRKP